MRFRNSANTKFSHNTPKYGEERSESTILTYQILIETIFSGSFVLAPHLQGKGIGERLISKSITKANEMGFRGMILFGNPNYYSRFGFVNAQQFGITTKDGQNFDPFMALELGENGLAKVRGTFFEDSDFEFEKIELDEFDKQFPLKEKGKPKIDLNHK